MKLIIHSSIIKKFWCVKLLKKFKVKINNKEYKVDVEEISSDPRKLISSNSRSSVVDKSIRKPTKTVTYSNVSETSFAEESVNDIKAPLPGVVLLKCKVGDKVKKDDLLLILESMKMENPIIAHKAGVIKSISVSNGLSVKSGDTLLVLK